MQMDDAFRVHVKKPLPHLHDDVLPYLTLSKSKQVQVITLKELWHYFGFARSDDDDFRRKQHQKLSTSLQH
ncbi:unnamed protein product [Macrosiphum euphorbiae]|uniref:Uncharacterized protein n=1 Tax=Macrosiphum euphorbiae TaxID=13131 RepID=A0AAV0WSV7_9HEMI|nr:unnamed protein product [Macrosiphum euphorbiae]